jgi:hypothetical protein
MTNLERSCLKHAAAWLRYSRSPQARIDLERDKAKRAAADKKAGHSQLCGIEKCHPTCRA